MNPCSTSSASVEASSTPPGSVKRDSPHTNRQFLQLEKEQRGGVSRIKGGTGLVTSSPKGTRAGKQAGQDHREALPGPELSPCASLRGGELPVRLGARAGPGEQLLRETAEELPALEGGRKKSLTPYFPRFNHPTNFISPEELGSSFYFPHGFSILGIPPSFPRPPTLSALIIVFMCNFPQVSLPGESLPGEWFQRPVLPNP